MAQRGRSEVTVGTGRVQGQRGERWNSAKGRQTQSAALTPAPSSPCENPQRESIAEARECKETEELKKTPSISLVAQKIPAA